LTAGGLVLTLTATPPEVRHGEGLHAEMKGEFTILFDAGSAALPAAARETVEQAVAALRRAGGYITVTGHDDNLRDAAASMELSHQRAVAVKAALLAAGAPADGVAVAYQGQSGLREARVDIVIR
jgi:outer membrane protein OmpA-like peptidoglycan-associated protein